MSRSLLVAFAAAVLLLVGCALVIGDMAAESRVLWFEHRPSEVCSGLRLRDMVSVPEYTGSSMNPGFSGPGIAVYGVEEWSADLVPGDVVVVPGPDSFMMHRVSAVYPGGVFYTHGDNNPRGEGPWKRTDAVMVVCAVSWTGGVL